MLQGYENIPPPTDMLGAIIPTAITNTTISTTAATPNSYLSPGVPGERELKGIPLVKCVVCIYSA